MSFLAPLFLLGAAAVALPIVYHLIRRTTRERTVFSSLLFLPPSPPRVTQRSRLEDLLLLALRCLIIALLALGFARPFLRNSAVVDPGAEPPARVMILVDTSASMRRSGLWDAAVQRAAAAARAVEPTDEVALWTFDSQVRPLISFAEWNATPAAERAARVSSRLAAVEPTWGATHLDEALTAAAEVIMENTEQAPPGPRRIVVISDLQDGSRLDGLQAFEWPRGIEVKLESLKPRRPGNAGLQLIADDASLTTSTQTVVRVRVFNSPDATVDRFEVGWAQVDADDFMGRAEAVQVSPGQTRTVALAVPSQDAPPTILLRGDEEPFDNRVFLVPPRSAPMRALYFGSENPADERQPLFFLQRAFPLTGRAGVEIVPRPGNERLDPESIAASGLYFVTEAVSQEVAAQLHAEVARGKTLLFAPRAANAFASLATIIGSEEIRAEEGQPRDYGMLGTIDFQHPLMAPFADPRFSDFTRIHFWKFRRVDDFAIAHARVIARFDSGEPAWLEVPVERGRVVVMTSCWHPEDSQLALSSKFVPLMLSLAELGGLGNERSMAAYAVGEVVPLQPVQAGSIQLRLPGGETASLAPGSTNFHDTLSPGIYEWFTDDEPQRFAVNLEGAESRTGPVALETLEAFGVPMYAATPPAEYRPDRKLELAAMEAEGRQKLWRWLILAALAVLVIESALAGWQTRRVVSGKESPA